MSISLQRALVDVRKMLEPYGENARLFVESRRDRFLSGREDGPQERREARHAGAALWIRSEGGARSRAWSGLDPQRMVDQVQSSLVGGKHPDSSPVWVDDGQKPPKWDWPARLQQSGGRNVIGGLLSVYQTCQQIWVVRHDEVLADRRTAERRRFVVSGQTYDSCDNFEGIPADWPHPFEKPGAAIEPGEWVAVYAPGVAGVLVHEIVGHSLEGVPVDRYLGGLPRCAVPFSIVDDPGRGRERWQIDDDGVPAAPVTLVDRGRVGTAMQSLASAERTGMPPTGHGRRAGFREPVLTRMGCTYLESGDRDPAEILAEVKDGLWIESMEAGTVDRVQRTATFRVARARRIRAGRRAETLLPFVLRCDFHNWWRTLDAVGNDLAFDRVIGSCYRLGQPLAVSVGAPTCRQGVVTVVR